MRINRLFPALLIAGLAAVPAEQLRGQATTTGSISGTVKTEQGLEVEQAQIQIVNRSTGFTAGVLTNSTGRYTVSGLEISPNYAVTVRRIGFQPQTRENVPVSLGQASRVDFIVAPSTVVLAGVTVTAEQAEVITSSRMGAQTAVTDTALRRLPTLNRNFTDFVALTPQVSTTLSNGGLSGGGTNNRYNNVQIDGTSEADVFGLGSTGQPGGQANGKSIGLESVKEYKVLLSPYDVRQGFFAGLLINAVTKSGTNDLTATAFGVTRNQGLARKQPYLSEYDQSQYGFSVGGPIVRNKAFFFFSPELQTRTTPAGGLFLGGTGAPATLQARIDSLNAAMGLYPLSTAGTYGIVQNTNPLANVFGRIDVNLPRNSQLVLRYNYGAAEDDNFFRSASSFKLSNNGYFFISRKHAPAMQLRTLFENGSFNELLTSYTRIRDRRTPNVRDPQLQITTPGFTFVTGAERFSQGNELDQDVIEITDNFTMPFGAHRLTLGTQNQLHKFRNLFRQASLGVWNFDSIDSLRSGLPDSYIVGVPLEPDGAGGVRAGGDGAVRFSSAIYSGYIQDEWAASDRLNLSFGLRADLPVFLDKPPTNPTVQTSYGINTADVPSGNVQWSPRVGFNWDVTGNAINQLRGGVGLFTGRPAYVWLSNSFQNSGMGGVGLLTCNATGATAPNRPPAFNAANIATPPSACLGGRTAAVGAEIDIATPNFKHPQNLRATLGFDRRILDNWVTTGEVLYTRGVNGIFYQNAALAGPQGTSRDGRVVYGTAVGTAVVKPGGRTQIFEASNQSNDYAYSLTGGLQRRYWRNYEGSLFYTYTRAYDVQSFTSSTAFSQIRFGRVWAGNLLDKTATRSTFEQRHRIVGTATYSFPTKTDVSVIYFGESGAPYTYVTSGDVNGDGLSLNDPIYVPRDATNPAEITLVSGAFGGTTYTPAQQATALEQYIRNSDCLSASRGRIMERNACTDPWVNTMNVSLRQSLRTFQLQHVTLQLDVFNFLNLVNSDWGLSRSVGQSPITLLNTAGVTGATPGSNALVTGTHTYRFNPDFTQYFSENIRSNYQIQLQARYSFR